MQDNKEYKKRIKNINRVIVVFASVWIFMLFSFYPYFEVIDWLLYRIVDSQLVIDEINDYLFWSWLIVYVGSFFSIFIFLNKKSKIKKATGFKGGDELDIWLKNKVSKIFGKNIKNK
jgi:hypothetical protein